MSYAVFNQEGVHLCNISSDEYQLSCRRSLATFWIYWMQFLNLMKMATFCISEFLFMMPVMWFWILVICRFNLPERVSDVPGIFSSDVIGWAAGAAITYIVFSVFSRPTKFGYHNYFKQHICLLIKQSIPELRVVSGPLFFHRTQN